MPSDSANGWWNVNAAANATPVSAATPIRRTKPGRRSATRIPGTGVPSVWRACRRSCTATSSADRDAPRAPAVPAKTQCQPAVPAIHSASAGAARVA